MGDVDSADVAAVAPEEATALPEQAEDLLNRLILVPEHKLMVCCIDKVACGKINLMFRLLRSSYDLSQAVGVSRGDVWFRNSPAQHNYTWEMLQQVFLDKTWHKAVFFRDPVERFISAFRSECEQADADRRSRCMKQFGAPDATFNSAVAKLIEYADAHHQGDAGFEAPFRRQSEFCGGMKDTLKFYNTVEPLDRARGRYQLLELLAKVGVASESVPRFGELFPETAAAPETGAPSEMARLHSSQSYLNTSNIWASMALLQHYEADYELFQMRPSRSVDIFEAPGIPGMPHDMYSMPVAAASAVATRRVAAAPQDAIQQQQQEDSQQQQQQQQQQPQQQGEAEEMIRHLGVSPTASSEQLATFPELSDSLLDRFIVIPEHNLLFCYIEKVACKNFNDLFRYVRSKYDPTQAEGEGYVASWYRNTPETHGLSKASLQKILVNKSWHKAVFFRDPITRFVSAYSSKCLNDADDDGHILCRDQFGRDTLPFDQAVSHIGYSDIVNMSSDSWYNEHFRRQSAFCGGLTNTLQYYDTVEQLSRDTSTRKVSSMLKKVGIDPEEVPHFHEMFPKDTTDPLWERDGHNSQATATVAQLLTHNNSWAASVLLKHYAEDYQLFGVSALSSIRTLAARHELRHYAKPGREKQPTSAGASEKSPEANQTSAKEFRSIKLDSSNAEADINSEAFDKAQEQTAGDATAEESLLELSDNLEGFVVLPEHHLLFCANDGVAAGQFNELFRVIQAKDNPLQAYRLALDPSRDDKSPTTQNMSKEGLERLLLNESWHKAIFFRDPIARFYSMYKAHCQGGSERCKEAFGRPDADFEEAVRAVGESDRTGARNLDPMLRLQSDACGGIGHTLEHYDTVASLSRSTSHHKVANLLRAVGVSPDTDPGFSKFFPEAQEDDSIRSSDDELSAVLDESNSWAAYILAGHFRRDYELFGMKLPRYVRELAEEFRQGALDKLGSRNASSSSDSSNSSSSSSSNSSSVNASTVEPKNLQVQTTKKSLDDLLSEEEEQDPALELPPPDPTAPAAEEAQNRSEVPLEPSKDDVGDDGGQPAAPSSPDSEILEVSGTLNHLVALPERKLLFCFIDSAPAQQFRNFLMAVRADILAAQLHGHGGDVPYSLATDLPHSELAAILRNDSWHKVVFYRDPILRFISAYSGCVDESRVTNLYCDQVFGVGEKPLSFSGAVETVAMNTEPASGMNWHIRPQADFCGGLTNTLQYYDSVEMLNAANARDKVQEIMKKVGVDVDETPAFDVLFPLPTIASMGSDPDDSMGEREAVVTSFLNGGNLWAAAALLKFYQRDYDLFHLEPPESVKQFAEWATAE